MSAQQDKRRPIKSEGEGGGGPVGGDAKEDVAKVSERLKRGRRHAVE